MPRFEADCSHPENIGCSSRCILYIIINYHCVADAYDEATGQFNTSCEYCNLCWDRSAVDTVAARKVPYAVMRARSGFGSLTKNHWLVSGWCSSMHHHQLKAWCQPSFYEPLLACCLTYCVLGGKALADGSVAQDATLLCNCKMYQ